MFLFNKYITLLLLLYCQAVSAFEIDPFGSLIEKGRTKLAYESQWYSPTLPIHENITLQAIEEYNVMGGEIDSTDLRNLIRGVRWNDDPLGMQDGIQSIMWFIGFKDSCKNGIFEGPDYDLLYRTHCGDLQFIHAMATRNDKSVEDSVNKMLMWAEFSYRVASEDIPYNTKFHDLVRNCSSNLCLSSSKIFKDTMMQWDYSKEAPRTRANWNSLIMFTMDCVRTPWNNYCDYITKDTLESESEKVINQKMVKAKALGSLLHLIQDSFSDSHITRSSPNKKRNLGEISNIRTTRKLKKLTHEKIVLSERDSDLYSDLNNRGAILEIHNYENQNKHKHAIADYRIDSSSLDLDSNTDNLIDICADIIRFAREGVEWSFVEKYLTVTTQVFKLHDNSKLSFLSSYSND